MLRKEILEFDGKFRITRFYDNESEWPDPDELERLGQMRLLKLKIIDIKEGD